MQGVPLCQQERAVHASRPVCGIHSTFKRRSFRSACSPTARFSLCSPQSVAFKSGGRAQGVKSGVCRRKIITRAQQGPIDMNQQWKKQRNDGPMNIWWKCFVSLLYFFPLQEVGTYGHTFIERFPIYNWLDMVTVPFEYFFNCHEFAPLAWFFGLYLGVVRNRKFPHVARYHVMLGTMIDIIGMIFTIIRDNLPFALSWGPYYWWFITFMFWIIAFITLYCMIFALKGWYVEIPILSDATYLQVEMAEMLDRDQIEGSGQ